MMKVKKIRTEFLNYSLIDALTPPLNSRLIKYPVLCQIDLGKTKMDKTFEHRFTLGSSGGHLKTFFAMVPRRIQLL